MLLVARPAAGRVLSKSLWSGPPKADNKLFLQAYDLPQCKPLRLNSGRIMHSAFLLLSSPGGPHAKQATPRLLLLQRSLDRRA